MVYLHVPFCKSFCTYCDFYSELVCKSGDRVELERYVDGVCREAEARRAEIEATRTVNTLYVGGGTPSVLPFACLERMVESIGGEPFSEFTVEVNPEDVVRNGPAYLRDLKALGVNRISMGVQSMDDGMLRWMNRRHDSARAGMAFELLRSAGFGNISLDLIFGISHMSDDMLSSTLREILAMGPEHISAYQLSIEEGSALAEMLADGRYTEASDEQCRRQYDHICDELRGAGFHHYEISNWSRPGYEAVHNSAYWTRQPYVGLGPGAHSLSITGGCQTRSWNSRDISFWTSEREILTPKEIREEEIMLGLRTDKGYDGRIIPESSWFVIDDIVRDLI